MAKKRLGIYGGTFSPPHKGHIEAAEAFRREMQLDELLIIPTFLPPHKEAGDGATPTDRLNMCRIAFSHIQNCHVSDMEICRGGKSYTYITLEELKAPDTELFFLCGTDMILTFDLWKRYEYIFSLATICYARRECDEQISLKLQEKIGQYRELGANIIEINHVVNEISSTDVRNSINSPSVVEYLTPGVSFYIGLHKLYGSDGGVISSLSGRISRLMSERRFTHTLGVVNAAEKIALNVCPSLTAKACICAFLHDVTKEMNQNELICRYQIKLTEEDAASPEIIHALTAPQYIKEYFPEFASEDILSAIKTHTTGSPEMKLLNTILFVADYIEENRKYESSATLRQELYSSFENRSPVECVLSLNKAAVSSINYTLSHLSSIGKPIHSLTLSTRESLLNSIYNNPKE